MDDVRPGARSRLDRVHPDDREHFVSERTKLLLAGELHEFEAQLRRNDGQFRYHLFRFNPVKDEQRRVRRWYSATTDIEDRKQAENKTRRLVDANILGIFIWTLEGAIVEANEAFLRMVQYKREDLLSGHVRWTDLTPAEWRERDERALTELNGTGTVLPSERSHVVVKVCGHCNAPSPGKTCHQKYHDETLPHEGAKTESGPESHVAIANQRLTDIPHNTTTMVLSLVALTSAPQREGRIAIPNCRDSATGCIEVQGGFQRGDKPAITSSPTAESAVRVQSAAVNRTRNTAEETGSICD